MASGKGIRGSHVGFADVPESDVEHRGHQIRCHICDAWYDCRDLEAVAAHAKPLPHPEGDPCPI